MRLFSAAVGLLISVVSALLANHGIRALCPANIRPPCVCRTTRYEPVNIICDRVPNLYTVCQALGPLNGLLIDSLIISNTPINILPAGALVGYRVKRLELVNNNLTDIDPDAFNGLPITTLNELSVRNNLLSSIPQAGVPKLQRLISISLANNNIRFLPAAAFATFHSRGWLKKIDLSANGLQRLDDNAFLGLNMVAELNLDKNDLRVLPAGALQKLHALEDLSLAANQISTIPPHALGFAKLKSLSLEVNRLQSIEAAAFAGTPNLMYLYLSSNRFQTIPADMFRSVSGLKVLAIANNPIQNLPVDAFYFVQNLVRLEMANCELVHIQPGTLQTIPKVQVIALSRNKLNSIPQNAFRGLSELYSLDLKGNQISTVQDRAFEELPSLRHLDLSKNQIQILHEKTFHRTFLQKQTTANGRVIYLYENPWNCNSSLNWLQRWLNENPDIVIDAPGNPPTVCKKPTTMAGWPIRMLNSESTPAKPLPIEVDKQNPAKESEQRKARMHLAAMILGVILSIFMVALVLLMLVRYFVSKRRRKDKELLDDQRRLGSTVSAGIRSNPGSAYPSPGVPMSTVHSQTTQPYYLTVGKLFQRLLALALISLVVRCSQTCPITINSLCQCHNLHHGIALQCTGATLGKVVEALAVHSETIESLTLRYSDIRTLEANSFASLAIKKLDLSSNNIHKIEEDAFGKQASYITELLLANNSLTEIPPLKALKNLEKIDISNNALVDLTEYAFEHNEALKVIRAKNNKISTLSPNSLNEVKNILELLDLSGNQLIQVPAQNLRSFQKLRVLDLSDNLIDKIPNLQFMNMPELRDLRLGGNKIAAVMPLAFMNIPKLEVLNLTRNAITTMETNPIQQFENLEILDLSWNKLNKLNASSFKDLAKLKELHLQNNEIQIVETMAVSDNSELRMINLANNKIKELYKNAFDQLPNLNTLILTNNQLHEIDQGMLSGMPNLQQLKLRSNKILKIEKGAFETMPLLTMLDVSDNLLEILPVEVFHNLNRLFWLDLSNNRIRNIDQGTFQAKITNLLLQGNPLNCSSSIAWLVSYLTTQNVRTFFPDQPDVVCQYPSAVKGKSLKQMMLVQVNETMAKAKETGQSEESALSLLSRLLAASKEISSGKEVPQSGLGIFPALDQITTPLARLLVGEKSKEDLSSILKTIPTLLKNLPQTTASATATQPSLKNIPPELISYVLRGGQIPGVPPAVLKKTVENYAKSLLTDSTTAKNLLQLTTNDNNDAIMSAGSSFPTELIDDILRGNPVLGLSKEETKQLRQRYLSMLIGSDSTSDSAKTNNNNNNVTTTNSGDLLFGLNMNNLKQIDLNQIPRSIIQQLIANRIPGVSIDMVKKLMEKNPQLFGELVSEQLNQSTVDEEGKSDSNGKKQRVPAVNAQQQQLTNKKNSPPYDVERLDRKVDLSVFDENRTQPLDTSTVTTVALSMVGLLTVLTTVVLCLQRAKKRRRDQLNMRQQNTLSSKCSLAGPFDNGAVPNFYPHTAPTTTVNNGAFDFDSCYESSPNRNPYTPVDSDSRLVHHAMNVRAADAYCPTDEQVLALCSCQSSSDGIVLDCSNGDGLRTIDILRHNHAKLGLLLELKMRNCSIVELGERIFHGLYVKKLDLAENSIEQIDINAFDGLKNILQSLSLKNNSLREIPNKALNNMEALLQLDLSNNRIDNIDDNEQLINLPKLADLNLANNRICAVHKDAFDVVKHSLQTLNLASNCLDEVPASAIRGFKNLLALHLQRNRLTTLKPLQFVNLPYLNLLNLAHNQIHTVYKQAFVNVPAIRFLYLSDNAFTQLQPYMFSTFENLELLDLTNNRIRVLPGHAFSSMPKLTQLYLAENQMERIEPLAFENSSLVILMLANNNLTEITGDTLQGLDFLQQCSLKYNQISKIAYNAFHPVPGLVVLDLSHNKLNTLPDSAFFTQLNLFLLDLSNNNLSRIPWEAFNKRTVTIMLQENPLVCTERIQMIENNMGIFIPNSADEVCKKDDMNTTTVMQTTTTDQAENVKLVESQAESKIQDNYASSSFGDSKPPVQTTTTTVPMTKSNVKIVETIPPGIIIKELRATTTTTTTTTEPQQQSENDKTITTEESRTIYPVPIPFLSKAPDMHQAYAVDTDLVMANTEQPNFAMFTGLPDSIITALPVWTDPPNYRKPSPTKLKTQMPANSASKQNFEQAVPVVNAGVQEDDDDDGGLPSDAMSNFSQSAKTTAAVCVGVVASVTILVVAVLYLVKRRNRLHARSVSGDSRTSAYVAAHTIGYNRYPGMVSTTPNAYATDAITPCRPSRQRDITTYSRNNQNWLYDPVCYSNSSVYYNK
ncbi:Leucine-rich repeat-containing protein let-4 [Trichinella spiralis]|uniref:Leucine-rich repeat-containing protein let-4 n=1 Tax=Trichinella spiralis TaxID=6334 RepID=A0A0V1B817_TRISP|nr:Leucine-rich repeat-containing protein let-4 [Trichinella spiralis]